MKAKQEMTVFYEIEELVGERQPGQPIMLNCALGSVIASPGAK